MTFYDSEINFAGLGHAAWEFATGETLSLLSGEIVSASINKVKKGVSGRPGELCGSFSGTNAIGTIYVIGDTGVYVILKT